MKRSSILLRWTWICTLLCILALGLTACNSEAPAPAPDPGGPTSSGIDRGEPPEEGETTVGIIPGKCDHIVIQFFETEKDFEDQAGETVEIREEDTIKYMLAILNGPMTTVDDINETMEFPIVKVTAVQDWGDAAPPLEDDYFVDRTNRFCPAPDLIVGSRLGAEGADVFEEVMTVFRAHQAG